MKRIGLFFLLIGMLLGNSADAQIFQKDKYPTKYVKGTKYYVHIVEAGHTVYAISKKYAIQMDYLLSANPGISDGLQIGEEVLIPVFRVNRNIARRYTPELKGKYLIHVVQRKETLYSIAKNYGVEQNIIKAYNPILDQGLKVGAELRIPVDASDGVDEKWINPAGEQSDPRFIYHEVFKQETLYSLSKLYGVSVNQIRVVNDGLPEGLKVGEVIRIPRIEKVEKLLTEDTVAPGWNKPFFDDNPHLAYKQEYQLALLLPFHSENRLAEDQLNGNQFGLEFYNGFKIGADEQTEKPGANFNIKVFDTEGDPVTTKMLLAKHQLQNVDLFIGPLYKAALIEVLDFARTSGASVVCPVQQSPRLLQNNPHLNQIWPTHFAQVRRIADYLIKNHPTENIVVIESDSLEDQRITYAFKQSINKKLATSLRRYSDTVTTISTFELDVKELAEKLDPEGTNNIVFPSTDVLAVTEFMNKIGPLSKKFNIRLFGTEAWFNFRQLDEDYLEKFQVHLPAGVFVDYDNPLEQKFIRKYRETFSTEPGKFAFLGYNTALYYISALNQYGLVFPEMYGQINEITPNMLLDMKQALNETGFENVGTKILKFQDLQWQKISQ